MQAQHLALCVQAMAELVAENARSGNPARTPQELAVALLQGGTPREAVETRLPGLVSTMFGRSGGSGAATETAGEPQPHSTQLHMTLRLAARAPEAVLSQTGDEGVNRVPSWSCRVQLGGGRRGR